MLTPPLLMLSCCASAIEMEVSQNNIALLTIKAAAAHRSSNVVTSSVVHVAFLHGVSLSYTHHTLWALQSPLKKAAGSLSASPQSADCLE